MIGETPIAGGAIGGSGGESDFSFLKVAFDLKICINKELSLLVCKKIKKQASIRKEITNE